jgi:dolichol-phosphate mannosyltransferase
MNLSVVVPARNEEPCITTTLERLTGRLERDGISYEILVVDDGSTDGTAAAVQEIGARNQNVRLVRNPGPHGFGYAVRRGLDAFAGDAVAIVMADGSDDPEDLIRYYHVLRDQAECAFGSRFMSGSRVRGYPRFKLAINRLANNFIRALFGFRYNDVTNAFKGYRAEVIRGCRPLLAAHFNLTVELPLKAIVRGYSYEVIPIGWRQRQAGKSRLRLKEMGSRYLFIVLHVWLEKLLSKGDYRRREG